MVETELSQISSEFFETLKIENGKIFHIKYHQKRYEDLLSSFGFTKYENLQDYITPPSSDLYRCKLIYTLEANTHSIRVEYFSYHKKKVETLQVVYDDVIEYKYKATNRDSIDRLYALRGGADDILIVKNGYITDTSIANIAFYHDGKWITPKKPLLPGTTRARLLESGEISEEDIRVKDIENISKIALLNAMIEFDILDECKILL